MEEFTIYCTEEQTKKALELCAPLNFVEECMATCKQKHSSLYIPEKWGYFSYPTAEQMIGWLRSKGLRFEVDEFTNATYWQYHIEPSFKCGKELCYKDAVLSLIDAALDYLVDNKLLK